MLIWLGGILKPQQFTIHDPVPVTTVPKCQKFFLIQCNRPEMKLNRFQHNQIDLWAEWGWWAAGKKGAVGGWIGDAGFGRAGKSCDSETIISHSRVTPAPAYNRSPGHMSRLLLLLGMSQASMKRWQTALMGIEENFQWLADIFISTAERCS